jgi:hypothetical protein
MPPTAQPPQPVPRWKPELPLKASAWCVAISRLNNNITAAMLIMLKAIVLSLFDIIDVL